MIKAFQHKSALNVPSQGTGKALLGRKWQSREKTLKDSFPGHMAMRWVIWEKLPGRSEVNLVQTWIKWNLLYIEIVRRSHSGFTLFPSSLFTWTGPTHRPSVQVCGSEEFLEQQSCWKLVISSVNLVPEDPLTLGNVLEFPFVAQNKRTWNFLFIVGINQYGWTCAESPGDSAG